MGRVFHSSWMTRTGLMSKSWIGGIWPTILLGSEHRMVARTLPSQTESPSKCEPVNTKVLLSFTENSWVIGKGPNGSEVGGVQKVYVAHSVPMTVQIAASTISKRLRRSSWCHKNVLSCIPTVSLMHERKVSCFDSSSSATRCNWETGSSGLRVRSMGRTIKTGLVRPVWTHWRTICWLYRMGCCWRLLLLSWCTHSPALFFCTVQMKNGSQEPARAVNSSCLSGLPEESWTPRYLVDTVCDRIRLNKAMVEPWWIQSADPSLFRQRTEKRYRTK